MKKAALVAASLWFSALAPAAAQGSEVFIDSVDVELVLVSAFVEDRAGRPVLDLTREDFRLLEDGKEVEISQFSAPGGSLASAADVKPASEAAAPGRVVVFIDNLHISPMSRLRVFERIEKALKTGLGPDDEVMVAAYGGTVEVVMPWSRDRNKLRKVLREQTQYGSASLMAALADDRVLHLLNSRMEENNQGGRYLGDPCLDIGYLARMHAEQVHGGVLQKIAELERFVNSLAGFPARKTLLHVSDGIPLVSGAEAYRHAIELCDGTAYRKGIANAQDTSTFGDGQWTRWDPTKAWSELTQFDTTNEWTRLAGHANTYQVSFYTLQAGALTSRASRGDGARTSFEVESEGRRNKQDALFMLADETGGVAMLDGVGIEEGLATMIEDPSLAYQLAFVPPGAADGKQHRLKVEVDRPGLRVRHRKSYRSKTVHERVADGVLSSLLHGAQANPLGARLEIVDTQSSGSMLTRVRLRVRVPFEGLVLLPEGEQGRGLFTVFVAASNGRGGVTPVGQKTVPLRIAKSGAANEYVYEVEIPLRSETQEIAVGLRDEIGGEASYLRKTVRFEGAS